MSFQKSLYAVVVSSWVLGGCDPKPDPVVVSNPLEVRGSRVLHYRTDQGDFTQPVAADAPALEAFVVEGGARRALTVETSAEGTFRIPDAPSGAYYVRDGTLYLYTDSRTLDLDDHQLGRRDVQTTQDTPSLIATLSNLLPESVDSSQDLQLVSSNTGLSANLAFQDLPPPGATSVSRAALQYFHVSPFTIPLQDASRGDSVYVTAFAPRTTGSVKYTAVDRFFTQNLTQRPGETALVEGTFQELPSRSLSIDWRRAEFEAYRAQVHPDSTRSSRTLSVLPTAGGGDAWYGYSGELLFTSTSTGEGNEVLDLTYGNPYPSSWGEVVSLSYRFRLKVLLPGTTTSFISTGLSDARPVSQVRGQPFAPRISPPQELTVDGANAQQARTLGSLTPRITWKAPQLGTPSAYRVGISRVVAEGELTLPRLVANLSTRDTSLDVPPGILEAGQSYVLTVNAYLTPGKDLSTQPHWTLISNNLANAAVASGLLTAPAALAP